MDRRLEALPVRLQHIRWIGGGSGAGKTTIARQLAAGCGLRLYSCDDVLSAHVGRATPTDSPLLQVFLAMEMDERWVNRSPAAMLQTFPWFQGEGFDLIVDDLLALPEGPLVVVEGFRLLPRLVAPLLSRPSQAVWLLPSPAFRHAAFESRGSLWDIARKTSHPEVALSNLLARDQLVTDEIAKEATALHLSIIEMDGTLSVGEATRRVARSLGLGAD
jgi:2-phosphoglycerate kinase